jgi:hypothetical protein
MYFTIGKDLQILYAIIISIEKQHIYPLPVAWKKDKDRIDRYGISNRKIKDEYYQSSTSNNQLSI